jgi:hypothetical protein
MSNVAGKGCREYKKKHFMFDNFFPKVMQFMRERGKRW